jgi:aspartate/methionine/tyrosine aminotransferase
MRLEPFLLDHWLDGHKGPHVRHDLGSSTGPAWTVRELCALEGRDVGDVLADVSVSYSDAHGSEALRSEIARMYGVDPDDVQVTTGAAEALLVLCFVAAEPGANVVLPFPCFSQIPAVARGLGLEVRTYAISRERSFRVDVDEVRRLLDDRTRMLIVNSPHNPSGAVLADEEMEELHGLAVSRGIRFVSDEVYHPLYLGRESRRSAARLPGAAVIGDCSKALSLSGLRVGWIVDRDAGRRAEYFDPRAYFTITNSPLTEALAALAVRQREALLARSRRVVQANVERFGRALGALEDRVGWIPPAGGTTAFPWLKTATDARPFCVELARRGVLVVPGDCFGVPSHFRVGFGAEPESFAAGVEEIDRALAGTRTMST